MAPPMESPLRRLSSSRFALTSVSLHKVPSLYDLLPDLPSFSNPIHDNPHFLIRPNFFVEPHDVVLRHILFDLSPFPDPDDPTSNCSSLVAYHQAGPRDKVCFEATELKVAIVTCGGLCPGMNTVVKELVVGLWELYGVREIHGIRSGYRGFYQGEEPMKLEPRVVRDWHKRGGTMLETSRGGFDLKKIVDSIKQQGFNQVYIIGGDGTMRGAVKIFDEIRRRGMKISVTAIPKTVDNDIGIIDKSFGFETAVEMAQDPINAAHVEAKSAVNGIGLVKLMGRHSGHIALSATLSSRDVDCCLIPENEFYLEGKGGLFEFLENRLRQRRHAVVVVAEGAGQELIKRTTEVEEKDESGNPVLLDVGLWLKKELNKWWEKDHPGELLTVKYIDPTYMIRAVPANPMDNLYCTLLAHSAIHGVMAGYTGFVTGPVNGAYAYIPMKDIVESRNAVDTKDHNWAWVRSITNQPDFAKLRHLCDGEDQEEEAKEVVVEKV